MARAAFKSGTYEARLDAVDANDIPTGKAAFTTRGHETWAGAARAALAKADRQSWTVTNRALVGRRIAEQGS